MTSADILLLLILAGAFLIGFFWGVVRGLLGLAAWLVTFLLAAHLSGPGGDYLQAQWRNFSAEYNHMLAFLITFGVLFVLALLLIQLGARGSHDLSRYPIVDDILGGLLCAVLAVLVIAAVVAILRTFYAPVAASSNVAEWTTNLYSALRSSTIGGQIQSGVVPIMNTLLDPLLPSTIRGHL
jgi:uncharacterized membrane protein required for colicin V production